MSDFKTVQLKRSSTASAVPTALQLVEGELAINLADKKLFSKDSGGNVFMVGADDSTLVKLTGNQTIAGTKTFSSTIVGSIDGNAATATKLTTTAWTVEEVSGVLFFKHGGVSKAKLDSSGNLTTTGNVTAYGTM
jgi:hypothetical protein